MIFIDRNNWAVLFVTIFVIGMASGYLAFEEIQTKNYTGAPKAIQTSSSPAIIVKMNSISAESHSFQIAVNHILTAMKNNDWKEFEHYSSPHITMEEFNRIPIGYRTDTPAATGSKSDSGYFWTSSQLKDLFPSFLFTGKLDINKYKNRDDFPYESNSDSPEANDFNWYTMISLPIDSKGDIPKEAKQALSNFSNLVKESFTFHPPWVESGEDLISDDWFPDRSSAVQGKVCSDEYWRIDMVCEHGCWVVSRLIVHEH